jgi:hypothetical protein
VIGIRCDRCARTFKEERALFLHFVHPGIKSGGFSEGTAKDPEDAAARFGSRAACGNDQELLGRGLTYMGWESVTGRRNDFWCIAESEVAE